MLLYEKIRRVENRALNALARVTQAAVLSLLLSAAAAKAQQLNLTRGEATVLVEPYAPNIVRVSLSLRRDDALAAPGYGITAKPQPAGWK